MTAARRLAEEQSYCSAHMHCPSNDDDDYADIITGLNNSLISQEKDDDEDNPKILHIVCLNERFSVNV